MHHNRLTMDELKLDYESVSNLRLRGGHGLPALIAARFISRMATIFRACDLVSSRRLVSPPRRPIVARYSRTFFSASVIDALQSIHHKRLMMQEVKSRETGRSAGARVRATARRDARLCRVPFLIASPTRKSPRAVSHKNPARQTWLPNPTPRFLQREYSPPSTPIRALLST